MFGLDVVINSVISFFRGLYAICTDGSKGRCTACDNPKCHGECRVKGTGAT